MVQLSDIKLLYVRELRSALRERNIVINSILLPIFLYPLILWLPYTGLSFVSGQTEGFTSRVMLDSLPEQHSLLRIQLEKDPQIELKDSESPIEDLRSGSLDLYVEFLPPESGPKSPEALKDNFRVRLTNDESKDRSKGALTRVRSRVRRYRDAYLETEAEKLNISRVEFQQFWVETQNIATSRQMGQFILGLLLPLFLIIMLCVGCMYPAIDSTAGEREKSTWETLMTTATSRTNVVVAKYLYVATMAALAGILNLAAMLFSMKAILTPLLGTRSDDLTLQFPLNSIPLILLLTGLLALFIAAGMMILASFARTFKEGQSMVSPFYIASFLPLMFLQDPGMEFTPLLAAIPIVNVAMVFRETIAGVFHWNLIGLTLLVEMLCISLALWLAATILRYEDFILGSYGGRFGKFIKERLLGMNRKRGDKQ